MTANSYFPFFSDERFYEEIKDETVECTGCKRDFTGDEMPFGYWKEPYKGLCKECLLKAEGIIS